MTDTDKLEAILTMGAWVSQEEILHCCRTRYGHGMTVHSRAADLRKKRAVECKIERKRGRVISYYRLVT